MTISVAQLSILAEKYGFDIDDARLTIGMCPTSKRGRPAQCAGEKCPVPPPVVRQSGFMASLWPSAPTEEPKKAKPANKAPAPQVMAREKVAKPKAVRGKTGYNLYMTEARPRVAAYLEAALKKGATMPRGAVVSEIAKRWRSLPESSRVIWNTKAAHA
jgi:hypothetical protein